MHVVGANIRDTDTLVAEHAYYVTFINCYVVPCLPGKILGKRSKCNISIHPQILGC